MTEKENIGRARPGGRLREFVPAHVSDRAVLKVLKLLAAVGGLPAETVKAHYADNCRVWEESPDIKEALSRETGLIERQGKLGRIQYGTERPALGRWLLGGRKLDGSCNTCEVIAACNAFAVLGGGSAMENFPRLLARFESKGIVLSGYFGTSPDYVEAYFRKAYETKMLVGRELSEDAMLRLSQEYEVFILTAYNDRSDITKEIHTMCITREGDRCRFHNGDGGKAYGSLGQAVFGYRSGKGKPICVLGIRRKGRN